MRIKITQDMLREIAEKYCTEHTPLSKLAKEYGVGKSTLVRYFNGEGSIQLNKELQAKVDIVKQQNWVDGKSTSGNAGNTKLTDEEIVALAEFMVENGCTLEDLTSQNTPVKSRIFGLFTEQRLGKSLYSKVIMQYEQNKKNAFDAANQSKRGKK